MANAVVGDWVMYRMAEGSRPGVERPALVVDTNEDESVDVLVHTAGINDGVGYHVRFVHGVRQGDEQGQYKTKAAPVPASEPAPPDAHAATALALAGQQADGTPVYGPYSADQMRYFAEHGTFPDAHGVIEAPQ